MRKTLRRKKYSLSEETPVSCGESHLLHDAPTEKTLRVIHIAEDRDVCAQIAALGIVPGCEVRVRTIGSSRILRVRRTTICLREGLSKKIRVTWKA